MTPLKGKFFGWILYQLQRQPTRLSAHQTILGATSIDAGDIAAGLSASETGVGLVTKGHRRSDGKKTGPPTKEDKSHLKCTHCGMTKHTKEQCFRLVGYPEWWSDGHKKGTKNTGLETGKASFTCNNNRNSGFGGVAMAHDEEEHGGFSMSTGYQDGSNH